MAQVRATLRSHGRITKADLRRLASIALENLEGLYRRRPETGRLYRDRLLALALCQGAAKHVIDGRHGIKDLDVWAFFRSGPARPFPYRRRGVSDFGDPKFGRHPDDRGFVGRRVDVMGRDIPVRRWESAESAIVRYLREGRTTSAAKLAERPVILLWPGPQCGRMIWRPEEATEGGRRRA